jgi:hypothetical protein
VIGIFRLAPASATRPAPRHRRNSLRPATTPATAPIGAPNMGTYRSQNVPAREVGTQSGTVRVAFAPTTTVPNTPRPYVPAPAPAAHQLGARLAATLAQPTGPLRTVAQVDQALARPGRQDPPIYARLAAELGIDPAGQRDPIRYWFHTEASRA